MATIEALALRKAYGTTIALDGINLRVEEGHILGLINKMLDTERRTPRCLYETQKACPLPKVAYGASASLRGDSTPPGAKLARWWCTAPSR